jgi:hypothetical protein
MRSATYNIVAHNGGWGVSHDGSISGEYLTKEAALEAAAGAASNALKKGYAITIKVDGSESDEPALGAD